MRTVLLSAIAILFVSCKTMPQNSKKNEPDRHIKVLIVDGFSNHNWRATTEAIKNILSQDPRIITEVSTVPLRDDKNWSKWLPSFDSYDVIIQNTNDHHSNNAWPEPAKKQLENFIKNGGGMLVFHSANNAFPKWSAYNDMIGLGWRKKDFGPAIVIKNNEPQIIPTGEGGNTGHGKRIDALVTRIGDHPIHKGLPRQWKAADIEIYRYARGPAKNITILSYAKEPKTGLNFPVEWTVLYGKGRVYTSTYGHYWNDQTTLPPSMRCIAFQTILVRAIYWLAKEEYTKEVPKTFPSKESISLSPLP